MTVQGTINLANVQIGFRNFAGKAGRFNSEGDRNFVVFLDNAKAQQLAEQGWNVKFPKPIAGEDPEDDRRQPYLTVKVRFNAYPPVIYEISPSNPDHPLRIDESTVDGLDWISYSNIDLVIRPYNWEVNGKSGVTAYLSKMYITLEEDGFAEKYGF